MTQHLRPNATVTVGGWIPLSSTLHAEVDEGIDNADDDATYDYCYAFAAAMELALEDGIDPLTSTSHIIQWRARRAGAAFLDADITIALYEGATLRATATGSHGASYTTQTYTLSAAEANAITAYTDLRLRVTLTNDIGTAHLRVTALDFDIPSLDTHASQRGSMAAPAVLGEIRSPIARGQINDCR